MIRMEAQPPRPARRAPARRRARAFTLIELVVVIAIIAILAAMTVPAIKSLSKSNDISQATNVVRSMISNARSIAVAQHRMAGIVFFDETSTYSSPVHGNQTALQLIVESFDQSGVPAGNAGFVYYSTQRQYLPEGVRLASLSDNALGAGNVETGDVALGTPGARAILFDANGDLVLRGGLITPPISGGPTPGSYADNSAYGDWRFDGSSAARSYPGFFLFNSVEYQAQSAGNRPSWLKKNSSVIIVNANTGGVLR
jgi:prepilin-type N-terminal cleavage/methylation domain-containing protein